MNVDVVVVYLSAVGEHDARFNVAAVAGILSRAGSFAVLRQRL